jgi:dGTPase
MTTVRQRLEAQEHAFLAPYASFSDQSRGREHAMTPCDLRTEFQRDRDRILHSKSFRRLKYKTQCFVSPEGVHFRTRLTPALEVSQLARTVARAVAGNEDLTEAIARGHDLGLTRFGHMGERTLARLSGHFEHNEQSLRVVTVLENMNLSWEVRDGILNHPKRGTPHTPEGMAVSFADRIAYINHDIDDSVRAGVLHPQEIPPELTRILGKTHGARIDRMIRDIVEASAGSPQLRMSAAVGQATDALRAFMFARVYQRQEAVEEETRTAMVLEKLYRYFIANRAAMPREYWPVWDNQGAARAVCDYIASMTDRYATRMFTCLFMPKNMG